MTQENRERAYKNFRDTEKNYEAKPHMNHGLTSTSAVRAHAKGLADALLKKNPELEAAPKEPEVPKPKKKKKVV